MDKTIGFIGAGNMGSAMIGGIIDAGFTQREKVFVFDVNKEKVQSLVKDYGIQTVDCLEDLLNQSRMIVVAVKPNMYSLVLEELKEGLTSEHMVITIAAGISLRQVEKAIGSHQKILRSMPNTPALVGKGMAALCANNQVLAEEFQLVGEMFSSFGKWEKVDESLMDSVIAVSGSAPAYVFLFIEAMADAAVQGGMDRKQAYAFASQTVMGAASMVSETGKHPGELKDMVCSPGGTTIEAVRSLEKNGFRSAVMEAMVDCMNKSVKMTGGEGDDSL